ncbi:zinc transport system ATP-binding protein [Cohaesibacter sp. ES.047]|uniref:metal ABC transporter ATP-binding protein n=1 Tax=Cohaesibacter sp. ES.047 TaxID=1798205 RepID=UPI000BB8B25F|nr:metal ABC transporter ATP-binding protein [Cohaesibacter sp. ES.047]SNY90790.1 zinc transport system ATP-binding protein [Cohaesibacter sp. ES.047]
MTTSDPLISGKNITVRSDGKFLLESVSISVAKGEIVTIIGPNGGGKTTLVKALLGLRPINAGIVTRKSGLKVGYVPQKLVIDRTLPLTVKRLMTLTEPNDGASILAALEETGVAHKLNDNIHTLSGGEMQRVLLARALVRKPDLMVLDEPVQGVDYVGELSLYNLIEAIRNRHQCGILLVSHDLHMVMRASTHVICLNTHVCCHGQPADVEQSPDYQRLFGAKGLQTMAPYSHHHSHSHDPLDADMLETGSCSCGDDHDHAHTQKSGGGDA